MRLYRPLATLAAFLALAGCSVSTFTYEFDRYGGVKARQVHLGCHDTYEIYDRPDAGTMLVLTNGLNEILAGVCDDGVDKLPLPERQRRTARIFLDETTNRPECRIVRETEITPVQREFAYRCPLPPPPFVPPPSRRAR